MQLRLLLRVHVWGARSCLRAYTRFRLYLVLSMETSTLPLLSFWLLRMPYSEPSIRLFIVPYESACELDWIFVPNPQIARPWRVENTVGTKKGEKGKRRLAILTYNFNGASIVVVIVPSVRTDVRKGPTFTPTGPPKSQVGQTKVALP